MICIFKAQMNAFSRSLTTETQHVSASHVREMVSTVPRLEDLGVFNPNPNPRKLAWGLKGY